MKLCYWRGSANFGDDLNPWLWPQLLPEFFDDEDDILFLGIGSILGMSTVIDSKKTASALKLVVGSGYGGRSYAELPVIDATWRISFVRGPRTAKLLGIDQSFGIGDPGSLICRIPHVKRLPRKTKGPAFMPHWQNAIGGPLETIAQMAGARYIDPRWDVERVLADIAASRLLVTESMHGAIVADALRVPWVPFDPSGRHHLKWYDWADTLALKVTFVSSKPSTWREALARRAEGHPGLQERIMHHGRKVNLSVTDRLFQASAVGALRSALAADPNLSSDAALESAVDAMLERLDQLRADFPRGRNSEHARGLAS